MERYIRENLRKLVLTPSVSNDSMDEIVDLTVSILYDMGLGSRVITGEEHSPVIIASYGKNGVCFSGHLDTVPVGDSWKHDQGEIVGSRMYGRGTLDMKGPCVSMMAAAKRLLEMEVPFTLIFTTDEEVSMNGALAVAEEPEITDAPAVVICEPTGGLVVNEEKGVYQFKLKTTGVNAHASMPEKGENAVVKMLPILEKMNNLNNIPTGKDQISCCVNVVNGGSATNVIPAECTAEIDVRFPNEYQDEKSIHQFLFDSVSQEHEYELIQYLDPVYVDPESECITTMLKLAGTELWSVPYGTEMVRFFKTNPNTFIFGPGQVDVAHKPDEWIDIDDLVDIVKIYVEYARRMA